MRSLALAVAAAVLVGACGDGGDGGSSSLDGRSADDDGVDALPSYKCWPDIPQIPRGTVEIGKGGMAFSAMPDTLNLEYGLGQSGFMVKVWMRMTGFLPGGEDYSSPANPFTRVRATFVDSALPLQLPGGCAERVNYVPNAVGGYDYPLESAVIFRPCWGVDSLVGKQLKITAEVMDATGSYATDTKIITMTESLDPQFHNIPTLAGCGM